jgi:amino-acid N-acetyltransferase
MTASLYYSRFQGDTFVIQAEAEAVENAETTLAILRGIDDLRRHGIRVVLVFGKGKRFEEDLRADFGARPHVETNRLVIPESALPRIREERSSIADAVEGLCRSIRLPCQVLPDSVVRTQRRIAHESTGVVTEIDTDAIRGILDQQRLAITGFGGQDDRDRFLHVPSVSLAADLAVELRAQKLLFLTHTDGILVPNHKKGDRQLSFADLEGLLCLLQRKDENDNFILSGTVLPKVHASIRAVAGGVSQVHIVSYTRLLDEILTRTGVGTMIERQQSHHVDYARQTDLDQIERLHIESQRYTTRRGTPLVKPLDRAGLERLLPQTLLLEHRGVIVGKLHATEVPGVSDILLIGGYVIGENHQDSQHGQLLLGEALSRFRQQGCAAAAAITASDRSKRLFGRSGGRADETGPWQASLLNEAIQRYHPDERGEVQLFTFRLLN